MAVLEPSEQNRDASLVLLTNGFPFGHSEPFIANELPYLAEHFGHITIATTAKAKGVMRSIPSNVDVVHLDETLSWTDLLDASWWKEGFRALLKHPACLKIAAKSWLRSKGFARQLLGILERSNHNEGSTLLYAYWMSDLAIAACLAAKSANAHAVARAHGWDLYEERHPHHYLPFRSHLAKQLHTALPISSDGKARLEALGFSKVVLSRLGVERLLEQAPQHRLPPILVSISSLIPLKRIHLVVQILTGLGVKAPQWVHFGDGPQAAELKELASDAGLAVEWAGHVQNTAVRNWLEAHADRAILINASQFEGIPVSMMEAMSAGIPCIGPHVGGVAEIIEDRKNGVLLRRDMVQEDGRIALKQLLDLPQEPDASASDAKQASMKLPAMRSAAFQTWAERYDARKNFTELALHLLDITQQASPHID